MKPIIGVTPLWDKEKDSIWMLPNYMNGIRNAGGLPVILPIEADEEEAAQLIGLCDGFLFTGGQDVSPSLYHEEPLEELGVTSPERDAAEKVYLAAALASGKPILGICRGIQFINAFLGGTLYQDLPSQHPSATVHRQGMPYERPTHGVTIEADSPLYRCLQKDRIEVNSLHHQAVKELAPGLRAMGLSEDGLIEAAYMPDRRFLWAVQWHPEFLYETDENSRKIFRAFVEAAE